MFRQVQNCFSSFNAFHSMLFHASTIEGCFIKCKISQSLQSILLSVIVANDDPQLSIKPPMDCYNYACKDFMNIHVLITIFMMYYVKTRLIYIAVAPF